MCRIRSIWSIRSKCLFCNCISRSRPSHCQSFWLLFIVIVKFCIQRKIRISSKILLFFFLSNTSKEMLFTVRWRLKAGKIEKKRVMAFVCSFNACNERKTSRETVEVSHCIRKNVLRFYLIRHLLMEYDCSFFATTIFIMYRNINRMKFDLRNCNINNSSTSSNSEVR